MGAAIVGGVGAGVFGGFDVIDRFITIESVTEPNPDNRKQYEKMMPIFEQAYHALVEVYERLAEL